VPRHLKSAEDFITIGENIHTTRIVLLNGRRVRTLDDGTQGVPFKDDDGNDLFLSIPDEFKEQQPYRQNQVKHFMIAVWKGVNGSPEEQALGTAYIHREVRRQTRAGATFLDLNVDEVSPYIDIQNESMTWLVNTVEEVSTLPASIDSSNSEIIETGLAAYTGKAGRPMINSVALERIDTIKLVTDNNAHVIVTAAGESGMPDNADERVENIDELMQHVQNAGIPLSDVYVDCLAFPISVASTYGNDYLDAVAAVREKYGPEIHITGGVSNVSFGLPKRRLINDAFLHLAIEKGLDSGIIDPIPASIQKVLDLDIDSESVKLAIDMLSGNDDYCMNYIQAFRDGRLD
jgi:cobalamin-dependent methionine synthase I